MNCVLFHSSNLFLLAVAMAIGWPEARANEIQAMMRGADQAFNRNFAEGFARKAWPRSRLGQGRVAMAKPSGQHGVGAASAAPIGLSVGAGAGEPSSPSTAKPPASIATAKPAPPPVEVLGAATEKPQAKEPDTVAIAPAPPPPAPGKVPARMAKAEAAPAPLPEGSASSPAGLRFRDCDFCPPLVVAPKGEFAMGSNEHPHEKPVHKVQIPSPFAIGQYEVTYKEWDRCVGAGACRYRPEFHGSPKEPAGNLSWDDANTYVKWLSETTRQKYRLPSEAEWEYAARAGTARPFWWGDEAGTGKANCSDCGSGTNGQPAAVGSYKPNPFGLYDTAGNMAEWVQDCWNESYHGAPADGSAWTKGNCSLRGLRGGSSGNKAAFSRSSSRFRYDSDVRYEANGFRVLRELR